MLLKATTTGMKETTAQDSSVSNTMVVNVQYVVLISRLSTEMSVRISLRCITLFLSQAQRESMMLTLLMT